MVDDAGGRDPLPPARRRSARVRLTGVYTGLYVVSGAVLLALVYGLIANGTTTKVVGTLPSKELLAECQRDFKFHIAPASENLQQKCKAALATAARVGASTQRDHTLHDFLVYGIVGLAVTTLVAAIVGWIVAGRILRPVHAITAAARRASERHLGERLELEGPRDELRELADTFDDMLARLDAAFVAQRRFAANASHELRTPLTVIQTAVDVTLDKPEVTPEQLRSMADSVRSSVADAEHLIEALLTLARADQTAGPTTTVDLAQCVRTALDADDADIEQRGLVIETELQPAPVLGDAVLLPRMVANLVDNAVRHNHPGGTVRVETGADGDVVRLAVSNSGRAVPPARVGELFEPFQRLDNRIAADGVGLGLSIVRSVVNSHHGSIEAEARPEGGLAITIELRRAT
jgi:signal transduction histidine kinase